MKEPARLIVGYILGRLPEEPLARRLELTRALSHLAASSEEAATLIKMADDLEAIERAHVQLLLDFRRRNP